MAEAREPLAQHWPTVSSCRVAAGTWFLSNSAPALVTASMGNYARGPTCRPARQLSVACEPRP
jgi:hypothetical protein